jgi:hypothetical protein
MKTKTRFVSLCFLFLILTGCSKSARPAYTPPGGEFSFVPPEHWVMREMPGFKYQFAFGQTTNNFSPNINFVDQTAPMKLDDYVTQNLHALHQMAGAESRSLRIMTQGEFTTDFNRSGAKVVTETEYEGNPVRQAFYFFEGQADIKFVITCTVPAENAQTYDKICASSIRTFKPSGD